MRTSWLGAVLGGMLIILAWSSVAGAKTLVVIPANPSENDTRGSYYIELLEKVLDVTSEEYGPFEISMSSTRRVQERVMQNMTSEKGDVTLTFSGATKKRDQTLLPVRIPLAKGMLGFRIFIMKKDRVADFRAIGNLQELKTQFACQGKGWPDTMILRNAGLPVLDSPYYDGLFKMLDRGRCDYFPRAVHEPFLELAAREDIYPNLTVSEDWLVYYPFPTYFYLRKSEAKLAERVEKGLKTMIENGDLEKHIKTHPATGPAYQLIRQNSWRHVAILENPYLHSETPLQDKTLWFLPKCNGGQDCDLSAASHSN